MKYIKEVKGCNSKCQTKDQGSPIPPSVEIYDPEIVKRLRNLGFFVGKDFVKDHD